MKWYEDQLKQQGYDVTYIESTDIKSDVRKLISHLSSHGIKEILYADPVDNWLHKRIKETGLVFHCNKWFLLSQLPQQDGRCSSFFKNRKTYFQTDFYIWQRKQRNLLLDNNKNHWAANGHLMQRTD